MAFSLSASTICVASDLSSGLQSISEEEIPVYTTRSFWQLAIFSRMLSANGINHKPLDIPLEAS
jgi:hypothetical protein